MTDPVRSLIDRIHNVATSADIRKPHLDLTPAQIQRNRTLNRPVSLIALLAIVSVLLNIVLMAVAWIRFSIDWDRSKPLTMLLVFLGIPLLNCITLGLYLGHRPFLGAGEQD